ncbi:MAG: DbpA RNA binding domain-containing protein, partial [Polyangiales bacterium]
ARREADLLAKVEGLKAGPGISEARSLARRLLTHDDAEGLIAALLREVLGAQLVSADEAAKARRAKNPPPVVEPAPAPPPGLAPTVEAKPDTRPERPARAPREEPRRTGPVTADKPREARPDRDPRRGGKFRGAATELTEWSPPDEPDDELPIVSNEQRRQKEQQQAKPREERPREERPREERPREEKPREEPTLAEVTTLFVNSGRRDGLKASDLLEVLDKRGAIEPEAVGRVRLRDRNTFVDVRPDVADRAIVALKGAVVHGRTLNAELARPRDPNAPREADDERPTNPIEGR